MGLMRTTSSSGSLLLLLGPILAGSYPSGVPGYVAGRIYYSGIIGPDIPPLTLPSCTI